jgi:hypothetical protein
MSCDTVSVDEGDAKITVRIRTFSATVEL